MNRTLSTLAVAGLASLVLQAQAPAPSISVTDAWARASFPGASTGAVYLTISDHGAPDRLVSAATPVAAAAQVHETTMEGNVMRMRPVDGLAVSAEKPVTLAPGGFHLMLTGLKKPLKQGESFPVTLTFAHAGTVSATVAVEAVGAAGPMPGMAMPGMVMPGMDSGSGMKMPMAPAGAAKP